MIKKALKVTVGIVLIPVVISITTTFFQALSGLTDGGNAGSKIFFLGAFTYMMLHLFLFRPMYVYALGHEMMHAVATWVSGGKVKSFEVGSGEGAVRTTKSSSFIALSPYFIPTWTLVVSLLYFVLPRFVQIANLKTFYLFLAGLTLAMHFILTSEALRTEQSDLVNSGYIFSIVIIYIANIILVCLVVSLLFEGVSFMALLKDTYIASKGMYIRLFNQLFMI